jgi:hypothetical protein
MDKLESYGIQGKFKTLIKSYLMERFQKVALGNTIDSNSSKWKQIKNGVPQGSILGPLLFLIYINDLARITGKDIKMIFFADDTSILISGDNTDFNINYKQAFQEINAWISNNKLTLNFNKTVYRVQN